MAGTVGELIEHLKTFDPNLPIVTSCFDSTYEYLITPDRVVMGYMGYCDPIGSYRGIHAHKNADDGYLNDPQPAVMIEL